mgnify:FL=1
MKVLCFLLSMCSLLNAQISLPTFQAVHYANNDGSNCSICDDDLVLYYDFENGSGNVTDKGISGNQTDGVFQGTADYYNSGKFGSYSMQSPSGSSDNDYLSVTGDITDLDMTSEYSIMAWVKILGGSGGQGILVFGACCSPRQGYILTIESSGRLRFWGGSDSNNSNYNTTSSTSLTADGQWHHIGLRVNSTASQIIINGSLSGSGSSNIPTSPSESNSNTNYAKNNPNIGGSGIHGVGRDVLIDDVRIKLPQDLQNKLFALTPF